MKKSKEVEFISTLMFSLGKEEKTELLAKSNLTEREQLYLFARFIEGISIKECAERFCVEAYSYLRIQHRLCCKLYSWLTRKKTASVTPAVL